MRTRLRQALEESGKPVAGLARATGKSRPAVYHYLDGREPPADFMRKAARYLGVPVEWLYGYAKEWYEVLGAETDEDRAKVDAAESRFPMFTPTEEAVFVSCVMRWLKSDWPEHIEDRLVLALELATMLDAPLRRFGTKLEPRERTDFIVAQLHALSLAMPRQK